MAKNSQPILARHLGVASITAGDSDGDPLLTYRWLLERWVVRIRWCVVPLCFIRLPLFPTVSRPLTIVVALILLLGNVGLWHLLRQVPSSARLRMVRYLATILEWAVTLAAIGLFSHNPHSNTHALLILRIPTDGMRYGLRGVLGAALGAGSVLGILMGTQALVLRLLPVPMAWGTLLGWEVIIGMMALIVGSALSIGARLYHCTRSVPHDAPHPRQDLGQGLTENERSALLRLHYKISPREAELLPWLAQPTLTYQQIGRELHISPETIKTHVRRLGVKLDAKGRESIVTTARTRGLLTDSEARADSPVTCSLKGVVYGDSSSR